MSIDSKNTLPLQRRIIRLPTTTLKGLVKETHRDHGWKVIYSEHSWKNPMDGNSGFIDLVLEDRNDTHVLIIESKKVLDTSWIFLVEDQGQLKSRHAKSWLMHYDGKKLKYFGLMDVTLEPTTPQSQYCVVIGEDPKSNRQMLERIGSDVVSSVEGFANEEKRLQPKSIETFRNYFNVVVTTAKLQVCLFDPANISVDDGKIEDAKYEEVPYLRFRKQLAYHYKLPEDFTFYDNAKITQAKENTVFVVNAESLPDFLREFDVV